MHQLYKTGFIVGMLGLMLCLSDAAQAKPWRNLKPFPAEHITWEKGFIGIVGNDKTRLYHLTGQGAIGLIPFLGQAPTATELNARQQFISRWLKQHPKAQAIPVEAYPFFSNTVARIYIWIIDGQDHLNLDLVRAGLLSGDSMMTILRFEDLYISGKQLWAFREKVAAAEREAAGASKGIWADPDLKRTQQTGKIFYPGMEELARFERAAANMPDPPPTFDAKTPEEELIRIADGDDNAASYNALTELIRRAETERITASAFNRLILKGLERQADTSRAWRSLYGSLFELAFQQGRLSEKQVERYAHQAIVPRLETSWVQKPNRPQPLLAIGNEIRVGQVKARTVLKENQAHKLLLTARYRLWQVQIDGVPVNNFKAHKQGVKTWSQQLRGGTQTRQFHLEPGQALAPGLHTLTGKVEVRILKGIDAWNAAGRAREIPEDIKPLATLRLEIDSLFNALKE